MIVTVDNQKFEDVTVWGLWNGARTRIGRVSAKTTRNFETEWRAHELTLVFTFAGGSTLRSERTAVSRGDSITYTIYPGL